MIKLLKGENMQARSDEISNYPIVDDMDNILPEQQPHFVWIDPEVGITEGNADQAINVLNNFLQALWDVFS